LSSNADRIKSCRQKAVMFSLPPGAVVIICWQKQVILSWHVGGEHCVLTSVGLVSTLELWYWVLVKNFTPIYWVLLGTSIPDWSWYWVQDWGVAGVKVRYIPMLGSY
jgi:hypothetical protein